MKDRLKKIREALGYSQAEFTDILELRSDISKQSHTISKWESGASKPSAEALEKIARLKINDCPVNINWLLTGEGEMTLPEIDQAPAPDPDLGAPATRGDVLALKEILLPPQKAHPDYLRKSFFTEIMSEVGKFRDEAKGEFRALHEAILSSRRAIHQGIPREEKGEIGEDGIMVSTSKVIPIERARRRHQAQYLEYVGAGGTYFDSVELLGTIPVIAQDKIHSVIRVKGDSMDPELTNGGLLFVQDVPPAELRDGDLAICWVRGSETWEVRRVFFPPDKGEIILQCNKYPPQILPWSPDAVLCQGKVLGHIDNPDKVKQIIERWGTEKKKG